MPAVFEFYAASDGIMFFVAKDRMWMAGFMAEKRPDEVLWRQPPELLLRTAAHNKKKGKKSRAVPDIGYFVPGGIIINEKSYEAIGRYLLRFGELLEISVEGETWFSYNVTNVLTDAVDVANSNRMIRGTVKTPTFFADRLPSEAEIFKVPETKLLRMYCNENSGESLRDLVEKNKLTGITFEPVWEL